jgi:hypothetical protein
VTDAPFKELSLPQKRALQKKLVRECRSWLGSISEQHQRSIKWVRWGLKVKTPGRGFLINFSYTCDNLLKITKKSMNEIARILKDWPA